MKGAPRLGLRGMPAHRATTAHLQALYPCVGGRGLGARGVYLGRDLHGGPFCFDPWELYAAGVLTNPNLLVAGQIGRGKSTFVKTFVRRQMLFGRRAWVVDPKGEYGRLAAFAGVVPLRLAPGGPVRLNPLAVGPTRPGLVPGGAPLDPRGPLDPRAPVDPRGQVDLVGSVAGAGLGRSLTPIERTALDLAVRSAQRRAAEPTLPDVVEAILDPDPSSAASVRTDVAALAADGRNVALELRRLVRGDLAGLFDGPTSAGVDLDAELVVLDLSALYDSPALGILMTCAVAWLQAVLRRADGSKRLVVLDEAWAVLRDLGTARWLQASFKLARSYGVANVAVLHRFSDLRAAGSGDSEQRRLAEGLLADSETRVVFAQSPSELSATRELLGLTATEADLLGRLPRGVALWRVGERSFVVEHVVGRGEASLVDTDQAMVAQR